MTHLKQGLSRYTLIMVVIGSCLGSGIFLTPSKVAEYLQNPYLILVVWAIGGVIAVSGALTFAELGAMFPKAGGLYVFLREAYGDLFAFLYGWSVMLVSTTGAIAALALAFAKYMSAIFPLTSLQQQILAVGAIVIVTFVNVRGLKFADLFTNIFTGTKVLGILAVIGIGLFLGDSSINFAPEAMPDAPENLLTAIGLALISVVFSYGGFQHASYVASETKNPKRNVPLAMIIGTLVITVIYVLINVAYMWLLPMGDMIAAEGLASEAVSKVLAVGGLVALLIAISTFGTTGIYTLTAPRIYFAMAKDKLFFKWIARVHPTFNTPANAILLQSGWAIVLLIFFKKFQDLVTFTVFVDWLFLAIAAITLFVFRIKRPKAERAFRTPLYPITPIIFIGISLFILINTVINEPSKAYMGLGFLAVGVPVYLLFKKYRKD